jgi:diguanylate cyclase
MKPDTEWRQKYFDALEKLEADEARWKKLENVLRLLTSRLCIAAQGRHKRLDEEVRKLANLIRQQADPGELEATLEPLTRAIAALDEAPQPAANDADSSRPPQPYSVRAGDDAPAAALAVAVPASNDLSDEPAPFEESEEEEGLSTAVASALERLAFLPELRSALDGLKNKPTADLSIDDLADALEHLTSMVGEQRSRLLREKLEIEAVLQQVNSRLEEMASHLASATQDVKSAQDSSQQLNRQVLAEMSDINSSVQQTTDLTVLRRQVGKRLDAIQAHLKDFHARETERGQQQIDRTQRMRLRIEQLEIESRNLHESLKEEQRLAMVDALTGIPNRAAYDDRIEQEFERWKRTGNAVSILAWDIDRFKQVNDVYGHKAGDKVLRVIGQHLAQHVRGTDFVARYGGEEFVMLLVDTDVNEARSAADKIRVSISKLGFHFRNMPVTVTASCGITCFNFDDSPDTVFERADRALYQAKDAGRNRVVVS